MIRVQVKTADGRLYHTDAHTRRTAATWLLTMALKHGPGTAGRAPITVNYCTETDDDE